MQGTVVESGEKRAIAWGELVTMLLDIIGLILISWYLFAVPEPVVLRNWGNYNGMHIAHPDIEAAINAISRNMVVIHKMWAGFAILLGSMLVKMGRWAKGNLWS